MRLPANPRRGQRMRLSVIQCRGQRLQYNEDEEAAEGMNSAVPGGASRGNSPRWKPLYRVGSKNTDQNETKSICSEEEFFLPLFSPRRFSAVYNLCCGGSGGTIAQQESQQEAHTRQQN